MTIMLKGFENYKSSQYHFYTTKKLGHLCLIFDKNLRH